MGAAMALHYAYGRPSQSPGVFALSGFLNHNSVVYEVRFPLRIYIKQPLKKKSII